MDKILREFYFIQEMKIIYTAVYNEKTDDYLIQWSKGRATTKDVGFVRKSRNWIEAGVDNYLWICDMKGNKI